MNNNRRQSKRQVAINGAPPAPKNKQTHTHTHKPKFKITDFVGTIISKVLDDLRLSLNQPPELAAK
jgi:hypothetical protein